MPNKNEINPTDGGAYSPKPEDKITVQVTRPSFSSSIPKEDSEQLLAKDIGIRVFKSEHR